MRNIGDQVKINFKTLAANIPTNTYNNILEWDEKLKGIHKITDYATKNLYTKDKYIRYELDNEFVFLEDELLDVK